MIGEGGWIWGTPRRMAWKVRACGGGPLCAVRGIAVTLPTYSCVQMGVVPIIRVQVGAA